MSIDKEVGARLRDLRVSRGEGPERLAVILSVPIESYAAFESGRMRIPARLLFDLASYFRVSVKYFIEGYEVGEHFVRNKRK